MDNKFFVEVDCCQTPQKGQVVSGDVYIQRRNNNRTLLVLSDGDGVGISANVQAGVIASMAINYALSESSVAHAAETIIGTFTTAERMVTFTILDVQESGRVLMVEYGNPRCVLLRDGAEVHLTIRESSSILTEQGTQSWVMSEFTAQAEDRLLMFSDGLTESGLNTRRMPAGWQRSGVVEFSCAVVRDQPTLSAHLLARKVIGRAEINDLFSPKNDMTCCSIYFRQPRRILICSGPPFNEKKDAILADMVDKYEGTTLICGGTTAQIISRELGREISVELRRDPAGLPPTSTMEGVDLITEGVLTMNKVKTLLERSEGIDLEETGTHARVAGMLLQHDIIEFVVGTRINPMHQDPNLPVELELRRNLIKNLSQLLESKFMKQVKIQYI